MLKPIIMTKNNKNYNTPITNNINQYKYFCTNHNKEMSKIFYCGPITIKDSWNSLINFGLMKTKANTIKLNDNGFIQ